MTLSLGLAAAMLVMCATAACDAAGGPPPAAAATELRWQVSVLPRQGIAEVRLQVPVAALAGRAALELRFRDLPRAPGALRRIGATADGRQLDVERPSRPGLAYRIGVPAGAEALVVAYEIEPVFFPPGSGDQPDPADARSRLTAELGVLRTTSLFADAGLDGAPSRVAFELPAGWVAVTPWAEAGGGEWTVPEPSSTEYLGVGPFEVMEAGFGVAVVRVAVAPGVEGIAPQDVARLLALATEAAGAPPAGEGDGARAVLVVPSSFMQGGAAGARTTVQLPSPWVIGHELFHWWTHAALFAADGRWFQEGFTAFYGPELARRAGLLPESSARACMADLEFEMRELEREAPMSLRAAAAAYGDSPEANRLVYAKGALLAYLLDARLGERGLSLDGMVQRVFAARATRLDTPALLRLLEGYGGDDLDALLRGAVLLAERLPALDLRPATGSSGCARIRPPGRL